MSLCVRSASLAVRPSPRAWRRSCAMRSVAVARRLADRLWRWRSLLARTSLAAAALLLSRWRSPWSCRSFRWRRGALGDRVAQRAGAAIERDRRFGGAAVERFGRGRARRRALAERFGGVGGELTERPLGIAGIGLDRFRQLLQPGVEQIGGGAAAHFELLDDGFGAADQKLFQLADPAVERVGDPQRGRRASCRFRRSARRRVSVTLAARASIRR